MTNVTIVPSTERDVHGAMRTMGTKVMVGDVMLIGVTKIVLTAEIDDVWKADITCHVRMQPTDADATIHYPKRWWERVLEWIVGKEAS